MKLIDLFVTDDQYRALRICAEAEGLAVDDWVLEVALAVSAASTGCRDILLQRSPRRAPGARSHSKPPDIVICPHCQIRTRRVKNCDNCDKELAS